MELEHMRRILAERGMGWKYSVRGMTGYWMDANERCQIAQVAWHPDTDWAQCGMVIEAMREKGWRMSVYMAGTIGLAKGKVGVSFGQGLDEVSYETAESFTEAVSLAVARALEATDDPR